MGINNRKLFSIEAHYINLLICRILQVQNSSHMLKLRSNYEILPIVASYAYMTFKQMNVHSDINHSIFNWQQIFKTEIGILRSNLKHL